MILNKKELEECVCKTDLEFKQNRIKKLNDEFDTEMFHTEVRGGKAFAAE